MTATATETMTTDEVLVSMLTENTGRHFLDSGGAYGRNWERNAGKTVADFLAAPEVDLSMWERDGNTVVEYVTLDVFHFLRQRCDFDAELDGRFRDFAMSDEWADESWFACLDAWLDHIGATLHDGEAEVINTYNGEDCLSQVLQYALFDHPETGETVAAVAIHGGCDVRGGYTAPRMFTIGDGYALCDNADLEVYLQEPEPEVDPRQGVMDLEGLPERRQATVSLTFRGGCEDRYAEPYNDDSLDEITFHFGETPVKLDEGGTSGVIVGDGPAAGWTFHISAPIPSY